MDNSNTHSILGPYLASKGFHVIAIDWIGHGQSSHLPRGSPYMFQKYVFFMFSICHSGNSICTTIFYLLFIEISIIFITFIDLYFI